MNISFLEKYAVVLTKNIAQRFFEDTSSTWSPTPFPKLKEKWNLLKIKTKNENVSRNNKNSIFLRSSSLRASRIMLETTARPISLSQFSRVQEKSLSPKKKAIGSKITN